jgi:ABC-2 type transport system permease protein
VNAAVTMTKMEVLRVFRNKRYTIFTLALPVMMYLIFGKSSSNLAGAGMTVKVYYMISMATLGAFSGALMGSATRISAERKSGWTRQLRLTAMPGWAYVAAKIVAALATTLPSVIVVLLLGKFYGGITMDAGWKWIALGAVIWLGSSIFAALSVALGYRLDPEALQPATMLVYLPMILLGGTYFLPQGWLHKVALGLPTWRLHEIAGDVIVGTKVSMSAVLVIVAVRTANRAES